MMLMYMQEPAESTEIEPGRLGRLGVGLPAVLIVLFGIFPSLLFTALRSASVIRV